MVLQSNPDELTTAWRALTGNQTTLEGWRTIAISKASTIPLYAGRSLPGNEESLLVGFKNTFISRNTILPEGHGFNVNQIYFGNNPDIYSWFALCRQNNDNLGILSPEMEVGLFGELTLLNDIIMNGMPSLFAVESWQGPMKGIHDFSLGSGAIEVKSTIAQQSFNVTIGSLEQLDDSLVQPLFLAGIRLSLSDSGKTLTEIIDYLRKFNCQNATSLNIFNNRLLHAGFYDPFSDRYKRRFNVIEKKILLVSSIFPRLVHWNIAKEIRKVKYEIDLELIKNCDIQLLDALKQTGVID